MTESGPIRIENRGAARVLVLSRPRVLNAINAELLDALCDAVEAASMDASVRGIVLTGEGEKAFAAGADIASMAEMTSEQARAFAGKGHLLGEMLEQSPKVTIAAVRGFALGGGCELALACDFIYASTCAKFAQPEVKLGVIPGFGGTQRLLRRVGVAQALEICMTGAMLDAQSALRIGFVNRVVDPELVLEQAIATVDVIATMGPLAIRRLKDVIYRGADAGLVDGNRLELETFAHLFESADQREGMAAFLAKRTPQFEGR